MTKLSRNGEVFVMARVVTSLRRLKDGCLHALSARFARWTKPLRLSLSLQTMADLGRSKSELVAENALLRQQLIILKRRVKRPPVTRADRILLVLLAKLVRTWQQALLMEVKGRFSQAQDRRGNDCLDPRNGDEQPTLGR